MRWIVRSFFALLLLVLLGVAAVFLIPAERIAGLAAARFEAATGRALTITGEVRPTVWPHLGLRTGAVTIANAAWSAEGPLLQADGLAIALDLQALIGGKVRITGVEAIGPKIILERDAAGQENWVFGAGEGGGAGGAPFTLDRGTISGGQLVFIDHGAESRLELNDIAAEIAIPDYQGPVAADISAVMNGQQFAARLQIGALAPFLEGKVTPLVLALQAGAAQVDFNGRGGFSPVSGEGALTAKLGDLKEVATLAGVMPPALPDGLGARAVTVAGDVTLTGEGALYLRGGTVTLDDTTLTGEADLTPQGERRKISARIRAGALNLAALGGGEGGPPTEGWPKDRIDASALGAIDAEVALTAEAITLGTTRLGASELTLTLDRGRAVFVIRKIAAYQGSISGQFVINARKGLSVGGDLAFADLALEPLLLDYSGYDRLTGTADARLKFLGAGGSVDAIMNSLQGTGSIGFSKGEIRGLDIAGMLRTLDPGYVGAGQKTIFDAISATFTIADGVLSNDDLRLQAPYITAKGAGKVGLGARNQDYRLQATALADAEGAGGLTAPLSIKGSWAKPKFALDLESIAAEKLQIEAQKLEEKARQKLAEKLGVQVQDGEDLEAAARRQGEELLLNEAAKALEKLRGGN